MTKFEEEFNYLIELSGKVLIGQVDAEAFEKNRVSFFEKYETDQQQALPVVPEDVAKIIKKYNVYDLINYNLEDDECEILDEFVYKHIKTEYEKYEYIAQLVAVGYIVEKPQLFYLKNMLTDLYLACDAEGYLETGRTVAEKFTQQEIDSMQTGSYKQIEVTE